LGKNLINLSRFETHGDKNEMLRNCMTFFKKGIFLDGQFEKFYKHVLGILCQRIGEECDVGKVNGLHLGYYRG
jgi:hypothetical protein